jgi:hypothetical protein
MTMDAKSLRLTGAVLAALAWAGVRPAPAAEPAAIVEDVQGAVKNVQVFDYVAVGTQIQLPPRAVLVLGYLKSCARETITGAKVVVGVDQSTVEGGEVKRERVECDGGRMQLTTAQASKSGAMVFRGAPPKPQAQVTVYGVSPIITADGAADRLQIKRLDATGQPPLDFPAAKSRAGGGVVVDLAKQNVALAPGGLYQVSSGARSVVFKVDPQAKPGAGPAVGRLVRLP